MRAFRFILQVVVFLFLAAYLLCLETGNKVSLSVLQQMFGKQQDEKHLPVVKPSPLEQMRNIN